MGLSRITSLVLSLALVAAARAQPPALPRLGDAKELAALLDPVIAERMERLHIPGAAVVVVMDGRVLFAKGYGFADVQSRRPVDPERTIFRIGSITKVFTATALVQLADRGRVSLRADVNKYLRGCRVAPTFPQPVTPFHLLTHTAGFDEINLGRKVSSPDKVIPLGAFLKERLRRRLPPGEVISYSTYGMSLAGYLVESATGTPFKEYLRQNVFLPLGMSRTSITGVPADQLPDLATGYEYSEEAKSYQPTAFEWFHTYPASDINSTPADMARFMLAHLEGGAYGGGRILSERAAREMQRTQFRNHPRLPGWAFGFYESRYKSLQGVEHGGSMDGYSDLLYLLPGERLGLYVACNTESGGFGLAGAVKTALLDRYFVRQQQSPPADSPARLTVARAALERLAGKYRWDVYCHTCPPDARGFFPEALDVTTNSDGTLGAFGMSWRPAGPLLFASPDGQEFIAFREGRDGRIKYLLRDAWAFERVEEQPK